MPAAHDKRIDTVLCDVGDVILLFDHAVAGDIEARHGLRPGSLLNTALKSPPSRRATVGGANATTRLWDDLAFHGLQDLADATFCSADIRLAKPDPACYLLAAHHGGFQLDRAVYIDDTASWVSAGQALGLRGHVFVSAGGLRAELAELGLIR